ncbi:capsular biosynthesis protein [Campylobacter coli]|nr:capsular biosynthesis protein [Campylobacter coli]
MTIIFPMAGLSLRFAKAGYTKPKYMLQIGNHSVFYNAVVGFKNYFDSCNFLFIYRDIEETSRFLKTECGKLGLKSYQLIKLKTATMGQAHTVMLGLEKAQIVDDEKILIFNIDTFRYNYILPNFNYEQLDGFLEVFQANGEQWSFIKPGKDYKVLQTAEKKRISNLCSSGLYYFKKSLYFKEIFSLMQKNNDLTKGELYIAPMYNYLIAERADIRYYEIELKEIIFCGTPQEYERLIL